NRNRKKQEGRRNVGSEEERQKAWQNSRGRNRVSEREGRETERGELAREAEERGGGPTVVPNVAFGVWYSPAGANRRRAASFHPRSIHGVVIIAVGESRTRRTRSLVKNRSCHPVESCLSTLLIGIRSDRVIPRRRRRRRRRRLSTNNRTERDKQAVSSHQLRVIVSAVPDSGDPRNPRQRGGKRVDRLREGYRWSTIEKIFSLERKG
ncbi:hypothetical protein ALC56_12518, partial [Trachymyrmex septentrionalis]